MHLSDHSKVLLLSILIGCFVLVLVPYIQFGVIYSKLWVPNKKPVDRRTCRCSCFDTIFRGAFEDQPVGYKSVYWNTELATLSIYAIYVFHIILWYEVIKHLVYLVIKQRPIRYTFVVLLIVNIFPNYYSWWSLFIYVNEGMWIYLVHQIPFSVSEMLVVAVCLHLTDATASMDLWKVEIIATVSLFHIMASSMDQFFSNIILGYFPHTAHLFRDLALMIPDISHLVLTLLAFKWDRESETNGRRAPGCSKVHVIKGVIIAFTGALIMRLF